MNFSNAYSNKFDNLAFNTIKNLQHVFNVNYKILPDIICKYSIGIEIEIKFRYFFPKLFKEYFENKHFNKYGLEMKQKISDLILQEEKNILPNLEKTIACGIPRGRDKYYEFSFTPVYNLTLLINQIELLRKSGLIPSGKHALHITIGGVELEKKHYHILMILQLLFIDKERIKEGFSEEYVDRSWTWAKKGRAGIFKKIHTDLLDTDHGFEFKTFYIDDNIDLFKLFSLLNFFLNDEKSFEINNLIKQIVDKMNDFGLPDKNWENPHQNSEIWNKYIDHFDELSLFTKSLINEVVV